MGKVSKWFRGLLGLKKPDSPSPTTPPLTARPSSKQLKEKRRWSFVKSYREKDQPTTTTKPSDDNTRAVLYGDTTYVDSVDPNKHAIAVAAAQAAAAVVRLTSSGRCAGLTTSYASRSCGKREEWAAAVKIQAGFRGYLARRALRALKGLVKLQALVRGHIERKRTADWLQRMQSLLRAQERARAGRAQISNSSHLSSKSSHFNHPGPTTPEKFEHGIRAKSTKYDQLPMLKRNGSKSNGRVVGDQDKAHIGWNWSDRRMDEQLDDQRGPSMRIDTPDDEKRDKILEIDTGKPHITPKRRNLFHSSQHSSTSDQNSHSFTASKESTAHQTVQSPSSCEVQSFCPLKISPEVEENPFHTADNSPQFFSASSRGGSSKRSPFTSAKSDGSRSYLSGYLDHPNYMSYTESSKAKLRSLSAPKQRPQFERSGSTKRYSVHGSGESRSSAQRVSALHANFTSKAYPGSGCLDRLGMPVQGDILGYRY